MIAAAVTLALATPAPAPPPAFAFPSTIAAPAVLALAPAPALDMASGPQAGASTDATSATDTVVTAPQASARIPEDPHEKFNRSMFARYQKLDRGFLRPVAMGYKHAVPRPVRSGIRHFFANLGEPVVFLNFLLQGKVGKAFETLGRFAINSTVGIGGLVDVAKASGLPHRPNGFGDTLGFYGVKPGAYLFLPLVGPTTVRDLFGGQVVDGAVNGALFPLAVGKPFTKLEYQIPRAVLTTLDQRAQADGDLRALLDGAVDPYATLRSVYLQDRAAEIAALHGRSRHSQPVPANDNLADPLVDPLADPAARTVAPPGGGGLADPLDDPAATPGSSPVAAPAAPARR